jgi:hypothetical protein
MDASSFPTGQPSGLGAPFDTWQKSNEDLAQSKQKMDTEIAQGQADASKQYADTTQQAGQDYKAQRGEVPAFVPTKETAPQLAGFFALLGTLGVALGGRGKASGLDAMSAMTGMLQGHAEGNQEKYKQEYQQFQAKMQEFQTHSEALRTDYQNAVTAAKGNLDAALRNVEAVALKNNDTIGLQTARNQGLQKFLEIAERRHEQATTLGNQMQMENLRYQRQQQMENQRFAHELALKNAAFGHVKTGLGVDNVLEGMTPEAQQAAKEALARGGITADQMKAVPQDYLAITQASQVAEEIKRNPNTVGAFNTLMITARDKMAGFFGGALGDFDVTSKDSPQEAQRKIEIQDQAFGAAAQEYAQAHPDEADAVSQAVVMQKKLFSLALADAQATGRVTVYLEKTLRSFYDQNLRPETLIGLIKSRADDANTRLKGYGMGVETQRDYQQRFPLMAAKSVGDFMGAGKQGGGQAAATFNSEADAEAAARAGTLKPGMRITINGQTGTWQ